MNSDFVSRLDSAASAFPRQQKLLCDYIRNNMLEASMMTIPQLSEKSGVATATVVRTVQALGYPNFRIFKQELKKAALIYAGSSYSSYVGSQGPISSFGENDDANIAASLSANESIFRNLNRPDFIKKLGTAVDMLVHARTVYTLGLRSSKPIISSFSALLFNVTAPVVPLSDRVDMIFDYVCQITPQDILLVSASHPASKISSDIIQICHREGIPIILVTNTPEAPLCCYATILLSPNDQEDSRPAYYIAYSASLYFIMETLAHEYAHRLQLDSSRYTEKIDLAAKKHNYTFLDN